MASYRGEGRRWPGRRALAVVAAVVILIASAIAVVRHLDYLRLWLPGSVPAEAEPSAATERRDGYFTVVDENARTLFTTTHMVSVGDEFIAEDDTRYRIESVSGDVARAVSLGKLAALSPAPVLSATQGRSTGVVGIYHTHSDESYVPTDGAESIPGRGGILQVGAALADRLSKLGLKASHKTTPHDPHDAAAYERSRRTAVQLLKERPLALFDVHRDGGPAEPYLKEIDGREVAKAMIVVGRTNPKYEANLEFARRLKDTVNSKYPGLVKGIFLGKADFNQDLFDRSLLLEIGTEKTTREAAEAGASLIASEVPRILGAATGPGGPTVGRTIGWILGLAVAATFLYLWISTGSWDEMRAKIMGWFGTGGVRVGGRKDGGSES